MFLPAVTVTCLMLLSVTEADSNQAEVMYEWLYLDFEWPSDDVKEQYKNDSRYDPTHNILSGVKTYRGDVYVTVPRLKYTTGVPSTLNILVKKGNQTVLRPYPDWASQELGNCSALQCAMSMEVDPITGYMYVIDPGRSGIFGNITNQPQPIICPPKIVVYDLKDGHLVRSHNLPENLVSNKTNFLNDIVLDRGDAKSTTARWVYITDAVDSKLIIFDLETNVTRTIHHPSMDADPGNGSDITVNGVKYKLLTPIDGLAMSADFLYLYYCALGSRDLYQVSTSVLRSPGGDFNSSVRLVGPKISQTGGMTYATNNLYYGALTKNGVYRWEVRTDEQNQGVGEGNVKIQTETLIAHDDNKLLWPDSFTVDEDGYLWFSACRAHLFLLGGIDFTGTMGNNYRIWRINIAEKGYLADHRTSSGDLLRAQGLILLCLIAALIAGM